MSEAAFAVLQIGAQASLGTAVLATTVFPVFPGAELGVDRSYETPREDMGMSLAHFQDTGSYGNYDVNFPISGTVRFEDVHHLVRMTLAGTATPADAGDLYVDDYAADTSANTVVPYTFETGDESQGWRITGVLVNQLRLGFETLIGGESSPWTFDADCRGIYAGTATLTSGLSAPAVLETAMGQRTRLFEGPMGTAFDDLEELEGHLVAYNVTIADPKPLRATADTDDGIWNRFGRGKRVGEVTAEIRVSATSTTNIFDVFNVDDSATVERNWRVTVVGDDSKSLTIDHLVRFLKVDVERDDKGERTYHVEAVIVGTPRISVGVPAVACTRFYFSNDTEGLPDVTRDASWDKGNGDNGMSWYRGRLKTSPTSSRNGNNEWQVGTTPVPLQFLHGQFLYQLTAADTLAGTVKAMMRASRNSGVGVSGSQVHQAQMVIRIVSSDGSTVRGTLLAAHQPATADSTIWTSTLTSRKFPAGATWIASRGAELTPVDYQVGDYLVVEYGSWTTVDGGGTGAHIHQNDSIGAAGDLPEDESTSTNLRSWLDICTTASL
jgi:hypothetical protein